MSIAEMFLFGWAGLVTYLWQREVWLHKTFMRATAVVIEDVVEGKAKFVIVDDGTKKTFTIEKVQ
jgi:hypothetical protein